MNVERPPAEIVFRDRGESRSEWVDEYEGPFRNHVTRAGVRYRLVGWQIVSSGGEQTHARLVYERSAHASSAAGSERERAEVRRATRARVTSTPRPA
jgi:hypothetical protein